MMVVMMVMMVVMMTTMTSGIEKEEGNLNSSDDE